ncbi:tyrosine--tRNA ligase [Mycoplasma sp. 744]|uniref:tyrosine--tRNA ligase n=1 Tax=Mycoplasma sp. 744 TaxID=3108531 RepID=UPI002B1DA0D5|nr:tyrosine--tRNA ligase [Mycoplasma sp. 744]MEA4115640.1 tyrosine--tRNA ligase [Mycoplasma sp. 744]
MNIIEDLELRGILKQISNKEKFLKLNPAETAIYGGFDPSAISLHLGNYILIATLKRFQQYGYTVYALVGGATGMIGDPSFRNSERNLLDNETIIKNKKNIIHQLKKQKLMVKDNLNFYKKMNVIDFLRNVGKLTNVSYMLNKESVIKRIEKGLSFTEFTYQLLQGYDFLKLYQNNNVKVQLGGSDQWGNIVTGLDMINKIEGDDHKAVGITLDLLTDENGNKIGKSTGGGSLWLDKNLSSPYDMYQYLINQSDLSAIKFLKWLTFLSLEKINNIASLHNDNLKKRYAQKTLAYEVVKDIFGKKEAQITTKISKVLFDKNFDLLKLNNLEIERLKKYLPCLKIKLKTNIIDCLIENKVLQSKREAREFINTGALKIDNDYLTLDTIFNPMYYESNYSFIKKGKKQIILLEKINI